MENTQVEWENEMRKQPSRPEVIGVVLTVGVWFGIGATSGAKMVNSLEELISR